MSLCSFEQLGVISPMISNPHCLKGREIVTGWSETVDLFSFKNAYLTSLTVSSVSMSVFEQGGPIIASSQNLMSGSVSRKMSPDGAIMEFFQYLLCILLF